MNTLRKPKREETVDLDRPRIALVDDDPDFRAVVRDWLSSRYDTMSFEDANDLLDCDADALVPDLLITDVKMPGLNGYQLCETLRAVPSYATLPILFLTGVDSNEGYLLGQEAGASAYLTKPIERGLLLAKVEELLEQNPARR